MITKKEVEEFFLNIKNNNSFDTSKKLLWGYFFLSSNETDLKNIKTILEERGYLYVDIFDAEKEDANDINEFYLHMEKEEYHDVQSLTIRNDEMYSLVSNFDAEYDGFDLGNI